MVYSVLKYPFLGFCFLIHKMPFPIRKAMAWAIAFIWFDILRIRRGSAIKNVGRAFPNLTAQQRVQMARQSLYHMGLTVVEFFSMPFLKVDDFQRTFDIEGGEKITQALSQNRGIFLLSLHLGNGDLGAAALASFNYKVHIISKIFKSKWLNDLWFGARTAKGVGLIPPRKSSYEILKALKKNEAVIFVLDQYTGPPNGVLTEFFGTQTGTAVGLALFAQRSKAPVLPCYTFRVGKHDHYKIIVEDPIEFEEKSSKEETLQFMTQKYSDAVEKAIRSNPNQWMWVHRRWKYGFQGQRPLD